MGCEPELGRFFYGGSLDGSEAPDVDRRMRVQLERVVEPLPKCFLGWRWMGRPEELFVLERRIAYQARGYEDPFVVPAGRDFRSDLTSVPALFTWLVPRTGFHLPAALVHDGLVQDPGKPLSYLGPSVTRA